MFPLSHPVAIFLTVLVIILLGPVLFRRLRIPPIAGLILAGIAAGPYGFNILERDDSFRIFGDVGILYIMFIAAVDIDMFHLKKEGRSGVIFGLISFLFPFVAGLFGAHYAFGYGWATSLLIASMFASHTLVSYPVVSKFGLQNTRAAVIAVSGTIVAVMLALLCLAAVVDISRSGSVGIWSLLRLIVLLGLFMAAVGTLFPWLTRRFFRNNADPVTQFIFILALVFVASLAAHLIGLEAILGAFYAGLVLNRMIPSRSPLMKNIRFVGDSIFVPYFLIGVGMLINVGVLFHGWGVASIALAMTVAALASKWLAALAAQKTFGLCRDDRRLMFGLTSGKAAATIAAVMLGYNHGIVDEDLMNGAIVMILFCCVVASFVTERAALRIRMRLTESSLDRDDLGKHEFARQVVSVFNPVTSGGLMRMALAMRSARNQNPVTALFVRTNDDREAVVAGREALEAAVASGEDVEVEVQGVERYDISAVSGIKNVAKEQDATEIMLGFHRKSNIVDTFYGSMAEQLIDSCHKMVLMSRCFIPVETVTAIYVVVPRKAEYETGFHLWVSRVAMLGANIEAKVIFVCHPSSREFIETVIAEDKVEVDRAYEPVYAFDDFILLSGQIEADDLLVVIGARKGSISAGSELSALPGFLQRHFASSNLMVIYPRQF